MFRNWTATGEPALLLPGGGSDVRLPWRPVPTQRLGTRPAWVGLGMGMLLLGGGFLPGGNTGGTRREPAAAYPTATPIKHVVVIFQENVSFDHYFATYPHAKNPKGEPRFVALRGTPSVNGLSGPLLGDNPNSAKPFRLDRSQVVTCDMNHSYTNEQGALDRGLMDKYVQFTGATYGSCHPAQVMGYYDGNTVTALWEYAQHFALADEAFDTTFGPSTPGAINLVSGETHGAVPRNIPGRVLNGTLYGDIDPAYDDCSRGETVFMTGRNVGDLLNAKGITWGWFQGGFRPTKPATATSPAVCASTHTGLAGSSVDYIPHHEPFQYYASTANPHHLPPSSVAMIGYTDRAHHQYDLTDFWAAADAGNLPAVSFLKAPAYQDGHPGYSDPLDEQTFLVDTLNRLEKLPVWRTTVVFLTWDDSDGWYDHAMPPIVNQSNSPVDALTGPGSCGRTSPGSSSARCGYGPRIPLLVISPYARSNFVDHRILASQSSILRFIEDNWHLGRIDRGSFDHKTATLENMFDFRTGPRTPPLFLNPRTGQPLATGYR